MKNKILLPLLFLVSNFSFAQAPVSFGIRAGITSSNIRGDASKSLNSLLDFSNGIVTSKDHLSFFTGINANIPITENFSIEPGIYYSQKGYEITGSYSVKGLDFLSANAKAVLQSQYIDVPLLLKANLNGLQVFAGPQLSYLAHADLRTTAGSLGFNVLDKTIDATNQFNKWDVAITGGIGYHFKNGFSIMGSYDYGLQKIDANKNFNAYNNSFKIGIGANF